VAFDISAYSGDLILAFGGAVGGALIAALLAALGGRNAGVGLVVLGVAIGGAGLPLGWRLVEHPPQLALLGDAPAPATDSEGSSDRVMQVLQTYYPEDYRKLMALGLRGSPRSWGWSPNVWRAQAIVVDLIRRKAPQADDENMMDFIRIARDGAHRLRDRSPKTCGSMMGGGGDAVGLQQAFAPDQADANRILARFLEQVATHPAPAYRTVDAQSAMMRIARAAEKRLPADERRAIEESAGLRVARRNTPHNTPLSQKAFCDFSVAALDELAARSPHESAGIMRTLLLKQGF
jgi:hypothetical protein